MERFEWVMGEGNESIDYRESGVRRTIQGDASLQNGMLYQEYPGVRNRGELEEVELRTRQWLRALGMTARKDVMPNSKQWLPSVTSRGPEHKRRSSLACFPVAPKRKGLWVPSYTVKLKQWIEPKD